MLTHFFPLLGSPILRLFVQLSDSVGGILSDSYLGKFKTIYYFSLVYLAGNMLVAFTSIPGVLGTPAGLDERLARPRSSCHRHRRN